MTKNTLGFILSLIVLIPMTTRFGIAFLLAIEFLLLFFAQVMSSALVELLDLKVFLQTFYYAGLITLASFYLLLIKILSPVLFLQIGLYTYIPVFSYMFAFLFFQYEHDFENIAPMVLYLSILLGLALIRELCAFGTISFPSLSGLFYLHIIPLAIQKHFRFFGSAAGAFILLGLGMWIHMCVQKSKILSLTSED